MRYSVDVELLIDDIPGVKESAVIGLRHADFGEAVVAIVVLEGETSTNEQEIINTAKSTLANFKVPKRVIVLSDLPRNTMGKVQKAFLRVQYQGLLQQS